MCFSPRNRFHAALFRACRPALPPGLLVGVIIVKSLPVNADPGESAQEGHSFSFLLFFLKAGVCESGYISGCVLGVRPLHATCIGGHLLREQDKATWLRELTVWP